MTFDPRTAESRAIRKLLDRFDYPDELGGVSSGSGVSAGGGAAPTLVVAAFDALDSSKARADFVCDGTNDEEEIQAAIDALPTYAGRVLLTEGEFHPDWDFIKLPATGRVTIQGMGRGTVIDMNDTNPTTGTGPVFEVLSGSGLCVIRDLVIEGPSNGLSSQNGIDIDAPYCQILNVLISFFQGSGVMFSSSGIYGTIHGCFIEESNVYNIENRATGMVIANNFLSGGDTGLYLTGQTIQVVGNYIQNMVTTGIELVTCDYSSIVGNSFSGGDNTCISLSNATSNIIDGNYLAAGAHGIYVSNVSDKTVVSNNVIEALMHGIFIEDANDCHVSANIIDMPGGQTDNTYDGIILAGDSDRNEIRNNRIIGQSSPNQPRYGINISASTCDDNSYLGNRTGAASDYGTGAYNDAGTGTINVWPAAAAPQGDNLL